MQINANNNINCELKIIKAVSLQLCGPPRIFMRLRINNILNYFLYICLKLVIIPKRRENNEAIGRHL